MKRDKLESGESQYRCPRCGYSSIIDRDSVKKCSQTPIRRIPDVRRGKKVTIYEYGLQGGGGNNSGNCLTPTCWIVARVYPSPFGDRLRSEDEPLPPHTWCVWLIRQEETTFPFGKKVTIEKRMTYDEFCLWREGDRKKLEIAGLILPEKPAKYRWREFWKSIRLFAEI